MCTDLGHGPGERSRAVPDIEEYPAPLGRPHRPAGDSGPLPLVVSPRLLHGLIASKSTPPCPCRPTAVTAVEGAVEGAVERAVDGSAKRACHQHCGNAAAGQRQEQLLDGSLRPCSLWDRNAGSETLMRKRLLERSRRHVEVGEGGRVVGRHDCEEPVARVDRVDVRAACMVRQRKRQTPASGWQTAADVPELEVWTRHTVDDRALEGVEAVGVDVARAEAGRAAEGGGRVLGPEVIDWGRCQ